MVVVIISAVALDEERERAMRKGADAYLCKPVRLSTLRETLWRVTRPKGVVLQPPPPPAGEEEEGSSGGGSSSNSTSSSVGVEIKEE